MSIHLNHYEWPAHTPASHHLPQRSRPRFPICAWPSLAGWHSLLPRLRIGAPLVYEETARLGVLWVQEAIQPQGWHNYGGLRAWTRQMDDGRVDDSNLQERHQQL